MNYFYIYFSLGFTVLNSVLENLALWSRSNNEFIAVFLLLLPSLAKIAAYCLEDRCWDKSLYKYKEIKKESQLLNFMWSSFKNKLTVNGNFSSDEAGRKFLLSLRYTSVSSTFLPKKLMKESLLLLLSESTATKETAAEQHPGHISLSFKLAVSWIVYMHRRKMYFALLKLKRNYLLCSWWMSLYALIAKQLVWIDLQ